MRPVGENTDRFCKATLRNWGWFTAILAAALFALAGFLPCAVFVASALVSMFVFRLQLTSSRRHLRLSPGDAARGAVIASLGRSALRAATLAAACALEPSATPWAALGLFAAPASLAARELALSRRTFA